MYGCKIRSLAPSQRGKRPLLLDVPHDIVELTQSENYIQESKRRTKNVKDIQIPERKVVPLSDNGICTMQKIVSEHVSLFINHYNLCFIPLLISLL